MHGGGSQSLRTGRVMQQPVYRSNIKAVTQQAKPDYSASGSKGSTLSANQSFDTFPVVAAIYIL